MKKIANYYEFEIDGKDVIVLSKNYNGSPLFYHQYDIIIGPKEIFDRFNAEIFPRCFLNKGWSPIVRYI